MDANVGNAFSLLADALWPQPGETIQQFQYRQLQNQPGGIQPGKPPDSLPGRPIQYASVDPLTALIGGA